MGNGLILFHNLDSLCSSELGSFSHMVGANKGKNLKSCPFYVLGVFLLYIQKVQAHS